jgi:hypothetical protein
MAGESSVNEAFFLGESKRTIKTHKPHPVDQVTEH